MAKKKKPKSKAKAADPSTTIEIRLPKALFDEVTDIQNTHPDVIEETLRLIFHRDVTYGMNAVKITEQDPNEADEDGIFKLCQGS